MTIEQARRVIEDFLEEQYIISDSDELDGWIAHIARNEGFDNLAERIENNGK